MNGLSEYCKDALKLAVVKKLGAGEGYSAKIPGFAGLVVFAPSRTEVIRELKSALEGWVELSLSRGDGLPDLHQGQSNWVDKWLVGMWLERYCWSPLDV